MQREHMQPTWAAADPTIAELLLAAQCVDPAAHDHLALRAAVDEGHAAVVHRLLQDPRVKLDRSTAQELLQSSAAEANRAPVLEVLLADEHGHEHEDGRRFDPRSLAASLLESGLRGRAGVLNVLLADSRVWDWVHARVGQGGGGAEVAAGVAGSDTLGSTAVAGSAAVTDRETLSVRFANMLLGNAWEAPLSRKSLCFLMMLPQAQAGASAAAAVSWRRSVGAGLDCQHLAECTWRRRRAALLGRAVAFMLDSEW